MKFRRYAVTVMDNWTPVRFFWTFKGARRFRNKRHGAHLFAWTDDNWQERL